ncbi:hypothetical protein HMPREF0972_01470 [Actinomyces sp. oral taxon 848 str. F0332]|nr:hypothetical protein HMPREF0972_01470 [Actinomyces sp. oral taxon 848 str. F0332]
MSDPFVNVYSVFSVRDSFTLSVQNREETSRSRRRPSMRNGLRGSASS